MREIISKLNVVWGGVIKEIDFDLLSNSIQINLDVVENGEVNNHSLKFEKVSAHYFVRNNGSERLNYFNEDNDHDNSSYLELTSIDYYENGIGKLSVNSSSESWVTEYYSSANFAIEIWSSMLFIESNTLIIDGVQFNLPNMK
ncbi:MULTISPECIES: hypothetical protein [unclassified Paenibacillus]|uniref:YxiG family protein n=1 Tax=unclassified Paenibacillus TaxID=185978 RepID=UPI00089B8347|nr:MULTISPECIES: hypothetical protein [unclassified Paenibacillus]OMC71028.1 hypothetical protein BK126_02640 [Paenibacillus sp. FSL H7-0326]SDW16743.1 hypothetical protein SAMN05518848_101481 [Paenibacillus sp. PDC88]